MQRQFDDDEEEDVMFDRSSLLPGQTTSVHGHRQRIVKTICLLAAFFGLVWISQSMCYSKVHQKAPGI